MISWIHVIIGISVFFNGLMFHELGHMLFFHWILKRDVQMQVRRARGGFRVSIGRKEDYIFLTRWEKYMVYASGVLAGIVPLAALSIWMPMFGILLIFYVYICRSDFRNIWGVVMRG